MKNVKTTSRNGINPKKEISQINLNLSINYMVIALAIKCMELEAQLFEEFEVLPIIFACAMKGTLYKFFEHESRKNRLFNILEILSFVTGLRNEILLGNEQIHLGIEVNTNDAIVANFYKASMAEVNDRIEREAGIAARANTALQIRHKKRFQQYANMPGIHADDKITDQVIIDCIGNAEVVNNHNISKSIQKFKQNPLGLNPLGMFILVVGEGKISLSTRSIRKTKSSANTTKYAKPGNCKGLKNFINKFKEKHFIPPENLVDTYEMTEQRNRLQILKENPNLSEKEIDKRILELKNALREEFDEQLKSYTFDEVFSPYKKPCINEKTVHQEICQYTAIDQVRWKDNIYSLQTIIMFILRGMVERDAWERRWGDTRDINSKFKILQNVRPDGGPPYPQPYPLPYPLIIDCSSSELIILIRNLISIDNRQFDGRLLDEIRWSSIQDEIDYWEEFIEISLNRLDDDCQKMFSKYYDLLMDKSNSDSAQQIIELNNICDHVSKLLKKVERVQDHYIPLLKANQRIYDEDPEQWADLMCRSLDLRYGQNGSQQHLGKSVSELNVAKRKIRANAKNAKIAKGTVNDASTKVNKSNKNVEAWIEVEEPYLPWIYEAPQDLSPRTSTGSKRSDKKKATKKNTKSKATKT